MNQYWEQKPGVDEPWLKSQALQATFKKLKVLLVVMTSAGLLGGVAYLGQVTAHSKVALVAGDARVYIGRPGSQGITEDIFRKLAKDVIEATFLRTNDGDIDAIHRAARSKALADELAVNGTPPSAEVLKKHLDRAQPASILGAFVHPDVLTKLSAEFAVRTSATYYQYFAVKEMRLIDVSPEQIEVHLWGNMTSRDIVAEQRNDVYLAVIFRPIKPSDENPLGWMLYGAMRIEASMFFAKERAAETKRATTVEATNSPSATRKP